MYSVLYTQTQTYTHTHTHTSNIFKMSINRISFKKDFASNGQRIDQSENLREKI